MTPQLDPEETEALRALAELPAGGALPGHSGHSGRSVEPRDFARPMRLSPRELEALAERARKALGTVGAELARAVRGCEGLQLIDVAEVNAERLRDGLAEPLAVLAFLVRGQPGWLVCDLPSALAAVEVALGAGDSGEDSERALSSVERKVFLRLFGPLVQALGTALGVQIASLSVPSTLDALGGWRDGGEQADRRRLLLTLELAGPRAPGTVRMFLPGIDPKHDRQAGAQTELPGHLAQVKVELAARLGASDIPLAELLALEPGDVIPLSRQAGEPLNIYAEEHLRARGILGSKHGRLAIRIVQVGPEEEDA